MLVLTIVKPLGYDNALMQNMALQVYQSGRIPYIGIWIHDFPGIIYIHWFSMVVFGTSDLGLRLFDCAVQILFTGFLYRFWLRWLRPRTAALAALLYCGYYVSAGSLLLSERDVYGAMLIVLSVYLLIRARESHFSPHMWILSSGLVAGMHLMMRPTAIVYLAILAISLLITNEGSFTWHSIPRAMEFLGAGLLPLGLFILWISGFPRGIEEFYLQSIRWNLDLYAPITNGFIALLEELGRRALILPFAIYGFVLLARKGSASVSRMPTFWELMLFGCILISSLGIALMMRKYFSYHFAPFFLFVIPYPAIGIEFLAARAKSAWRSRVVFLVSFVGCTFVTYYPRSPIAFVLALVEGQDAWNYTYDWQFPNPYWGGAAERASCRYLQRSENKDGRIEVCSYDPHLVLHCGHEQTTRYVVLNAIALRANTSTDGLPAYTDYQKKWQKEYVDSLRLVQPRFIVLARNTHFVYLNDPYESCLRFLPCFDSLLRSSYCYDTTFGGYQIFRSRSDSTSRK